jgi:hypothetical protein
MKYIIMMNTMRAGHGVPESVSTRSFANPASWSQPKVCLFPIRLSWCGPVRMACPSQTANFRRARNFWRDIGLSMSSLRSELTRSRQNYRRRRVPAGNP